MYSNYIPTMTWILCAPFQFVSFFVEQVLPEGTLNEHKSIYQFGISLVASLPQHNQIQKSTSNKLPIIGEMCLELCHRARFTLSVSDHFREKKSKCGEIDLK